MLTSVDFLKFKLPNPLVLSIAITLGACGGGNEEQTGTTDSNGTQSESGVANTDSNSSVGGSTSMSSAAFPEGYTGALVSNAAPVNTVFTLPGRAFTSPPNSWGLVSGERAFQGAFAVDDSTNVIVGILEPRPEHAIEGAVTDIHIHSGFAGESGPILATLVEREDGSYEVPDSTVLTAAQKASFEQGGLYVNIHTDIFPDGEVRGQLPGPDEGKSAFSNAGVSWQDAIPQTFSTHVGISFATLNKQTGELRGSVFVNDLLGVTAVELGAGWAPTENDPSTDTVLISLVQDAADSAVWRLPSGAILPQEHRALFGEGKLFFNVITVDHPTGEIRSQF